MFQAYDYDMVVLNTYHSLAANHTAATLKISSRRVERFSLLGSPVPWEKISNDK